MSRCEEEHCGQAVPSPQIQCLTRQIFATATTTAVRQEMLQVLVNCSFNQSLFTQKLISGEYSWAEVSKKLKAAKKMAYHQVCPIGRQVADGA